MVLVRRDGGNDANVGARVGVMVDDGGAGLMLLPMLMQLRLMRMMLMQLVTAMLMLNAWFYKSH